MSKVRKCSCRLCRESVFIKKLQKSGTIQELRSYVRELAERLWMTEEDLNWHQATMDGSWPQAVEILSQHLKAAKRIAAERSRHES